MLMDGESGGTVQGAAAALLRLGIPEKELKNNHKRPEGKRPAL
jgi:hypothetical protein